jgi:dihydropyrimidinase
MGFDTIIANGRVVTATDTFTGDVAITNGKIEATGNSLPRENAGTIIDAAGRYVFPGGIDVHTHLDMPFGGTTSADDFETGTRAAAFGGTTCLIDFAIQYKGQTLRTAFDAWMQKASTRAVGDYSFH